MDNREVYVLLKKASELLNLANYGLLRENFDPVSLSTEITKFCNLLDSKIQESEDDIKSSECKNFTR